MNTGKRYSKEYLEYQAGVPKIEGSTLSEIQDTHMCNLSIAYARIYANNGKSFVCSFLKYPSIRTACAFIVQTYKHRNLFEACQECGKDFSEYANRQPIEEKWKRVLAEVLLIIYSLINHQEDGT